MHKAGGARKAPVPLTFAQECAKVLKGCAHDTLDALFRHLRADLKEHQFITMPRWHQHELLDAEGDGAMRYVELVLGDRMQFGGSTRQFLRISLCLCKAGEGQVQCLLRLEVFALDAGNASTTLACLEQHHPMPWPEVRPALWAYLTTVRGQREVLAGRLRSQLLDTIAP